MKRILLCGDMFFVLMEKEDKKPYLEKQVHKEYLIIHNRHKTNIVSSFSPGNTGITGFLNGYGLEYSFETVLKRV